MLSIYRKLLPLAIILLLFISACSSSKPPSRWDQAQQGGSASSTTKPAITNPDGSKLPDNKIPENKTGDNKPLDGGAFNKFFPAAGNGFDRVASQEKEGFAEYKLKKGGKDVAMLSISDTANNPSAVQKFKDSKDQLGGYPSTQLGSTTTSILVADRYQVKAISKDPSFSKSDREAWLQKFDLAGLAKVKK